MNQTELNTFKRKYFDLSKRIIEGAIIHDPGTTPGHRALIEKICNWAHNNKYSYFTRSYLKEGKIVDVVIPELPRPFIEVRDSEKKKTKEYLNKYEDLIVFVDVDDPFNLL